MIALELQKVWVVLGDLDDDLMRVISEIFFLRFLDEDFLGAVAKNKTLEMISKSISRLALLMQSKAQTAKSSTLVKTPVTIVLEKVEQHVPVTPARVQVRYANVFRHSLARWSKHVHVIPVMAQVRKS